MIHRPLPVLLALVLGIATARGGEAVRLTYRLPTGTIARYNTSSTVGQSLTVMGSEVLTEVQTRLSLRLAVRETVLQRSTMDLAWTDCSIIMRSAGEGPANRADSVVTVPTNGFTQRVTITPDGSVVARDNMVRDQAIADVLALVNSTKIPDRLFVPFPVVDVSPGDSWTMQLLDSTSSQQGRGQVLTTGTVQYRYRGTLDTLGRRCWVIDVNSPDLAQHGTLVGAVIEMRIDGTGALHGTTIHDAQTGLLLTSSTQLETRVLMSGLGMPEGAQNISVPVYSQTNIVIERVEGKGR